MCDVGIKGRGLSETADCRAIHWAVAWAVGCGVVVGLALGSKRRELSARAALLALALALLFGFLVLGVSFARAFLLEYSLGRLSLGRLMYFFVLWIVAV